MLPTRSCMQMTLFSFRTARVRRPFTTAPKASFQPRLAQPFISSDMEEPSKIQLYEPALPTQADRRLELLTGYESLDDTKDGISLRAYWRILRNRRWAVLSALFVILTMVTIYTARQKPVLRGTSMLEIDQENSNVVTVEEIFQLQNVSENYLNTQYKILQSDSLGRNVIKKLDLDQAKEFKPPKR